MKNLPELPGVSVLALLARKFLKKQFLQIAIVLPGVIIFILAGLQPAAGQAPATFRHPGVLLNQAQLDFIKTQVNAGKDPWLSAFNKASADAHASLSYTPHPWQTVECGPSSNPNYGCSDERSDSEAAYTQALLWYITGNQAYAQNSIMIMNAWSSTLTGGHINSNADLQAGWTGSVWPEAAEIIRYTYNGWSATDVADFQNMLATQYVPNLINGAPCKNGNWELIITEALMNISVFNENPTWFNKAVSLWRARVPAYMYLSSDGPTPVPPPNCSTSVTTYWNQTQFVDGLAQESARDFGHTFWGLAASVNTAETAFQQGIDLYAENAQRIIAAFEFHDYINNGGAAPSGINLGPIGGNANTMEIVYNHYVNRRGNSMPQTAQQIAHWRPTGLNYFLVWETLTHAQVGWVGLQPDFSLSATPASQTVTAGGSTSYTMSVGPTNGFTGTVNLSVSGLPSGATGTFNPTSISRSGLATLNVSTSSLTAIGGYTLTITGTDTSGSLSHSASVTLTVNPAPVPDFTVSATPNSQSVTAGGSTNYTATVSPVNGYAGTVSLSVSGLPTGDSGSFNPASISGGSGASTLTISTGSSTAAGSYPLTITGTDGAGLSHTASVTLVVTAPQTCVTTTTGGAWQNTAFTNQTGTFTVTFDATPSASPINAVVGLSNGVQTAYTGFAAIARFNPSGDIDARNGGAYGAASIIPYSGGVSYHFREVVNVPAHTYSIYVTAPGRSEQTVGSNFAFRTEQNTVTQLNWWGVYSEVGSATVCNFALGNPDFSLSATPGTQTVTAGNSTSYTVNVGALNGFSGSVSLSVSGAPAGVTATLNPSAVSASGSSTLSVSTSSSTVAGSYVLTITGSSGSLSHSVTVTLIVNPPPAPDFTLSMTPSSQTVTVGGNTSYTASVSPLNSFNGTVSLSVSGLPTGATGSFNPVSIGSGSGSSTLSVATNSSTPTGTYTLTITGSSGSLSHSASATLIVNPVGPGSLAIAAESESGDDGGGHTVATTIDGNFSTYWQSTTNGTSTAFVQYDLGANYTVSSVKIAWYLGNTRSTWFDVLTSTDGTNWATVVNGANSSGTTTAFETYSFSAGTARYVRYVCHGTSIDNVNAIAESQIIGQ